MSEHYDQSNGLFPFFTKGNYMNFSLLIRYFLIKHLQQKIKIINGFTKFLNFIENGVAKLL